MSYLASIPRILIIDDLYGRTHVDRRNQERSSLCGLYLLQDITGDEEGKGHTLKVNKPVAEAFFFRGQTPKTSSVGDIVENDLEGTLKVIAGGWNKPPYWSLVLLDLCFYTGHVTETSNKKMFGMSEGRPSDDDPRQYFGLQILSAIKEKFPGLPVVILSSKPEDEVSRDYTKLGALGFIARADEKGPDNLREHIYRNALIPDATGEIIGYSKALTYALRELRRCAAQGGRRNLLFRGETGTGKKLFALYAHQQRTVQAQDIPFFVVNCPQISQDLFASELFGHKKGSFTDAKDDKIGIIEKADGGDIFLDEIAELPPGVQAGILKVIEERIYTRLGDTSVKKADIRFLSATNSTLIELREDLLMRLTEGGTINLPPLRERKDDIVLLVEKFVRDAERTTNARERKIEPETIAKLVRYNWPGNVRELQNFIYEAVQRYSKLPYLVPEHIHLPEERAESEAILSLGPSNISETLNVNISGFQEYVLPQILREHHQKVVQYIISALEYCKDKRNDEPNYPKTWHAMTGENVKSSATCQRNIGNYIFQLDDQHIMLFMQESSVFRKAVIQCGKKIQSIVKRLPKFENIEVNNNK